MRPREGRGAHARPRNGGRAVGQWWANGGRTAWCRTPGTRTLDSVIGRAVARCRSREWWPDRPLYPRKEARMSERESQHAVPAPPPETLLGMMTSYWTSQAVYAAAKPGIADLLAEGPVACDALAAATGSHAPSLYRLLRALASAGVFTERAPGRFALT